MRSPVDGNFVPSHNGQLENGEQVDGSDWAENIMKKTLYADLFRLYSQRRAMLRHGMC